MGIVLKVTAVKGKSPKRGFDHYWTVMMDYAVAERSFTARDVFNHSNAQQSDINDFMRRLVKAGFIEPVASDRDAATYKVIIRQSMTPKVRRDGTVIEGVSKQKAMWNHMRMSAGAQGFTAQDISIWASTDETRIGIEAAKSYIKFLAKAGYLTEVQKGKSGNLGIYRLSPDMNTGPLPPIILRAKGVFDQNRHEIVGPVETEEVQP
ncbi:hypothetical protein DEA98_05260 [Brucella pseudogrignonensis]|nr:hypothetical protein [Brucella pseudogrignonensis]